MCSVPAGCHLLVNFIRMQFGIRVKFVREWLPINANNNDFDFASKYVCCPESDQRAHANARGRRYEDELPTKHDGR